MRQVHYTKPSTHKKGNKIWLEGSKLEDAGFTASARYDAAYHMDRKVIHLFLDPAGKRSVTNSKRGGKDRPVIDLQNAKVTEMFAGVERIQVVIMECEIVIQPHHEDLKQDKREQQYSERMKSGGLVEASMFTGGGVSTEAIHQAISSTGRTSRTAWVAELEQKYIESAGSNCKAIDDDTVFLLGNVEEIEHRYYTNCDVLSFSMPCAGHSKAGKSKHKLSAIDHSGVTLFPVMAAIKAANPAVIVSENVTEAQDSPVYQLLKLELERMGYKVFEQILDCTHTDSVEQRRRYWLVAISAGLAPAALELAPVAQSGRQLAEILDEQPESEWRIQAGLAAKAIRDREAGKGFRRQLLTGIEKRVGTIGRYYHKRRSTEPFITRADGKERLLSPTEHARAKSAPAYLIAGLKTGCAHEILGQSVDYLQPYKLMQAIMGATSQ